MSLQDDIGRYVAEGGPDQGGFERIAAGLERDYYLVKLVDLPDVAVGHYGALNAGGTVIPKDTPTLDVWDAVHEYLALALHAESRDSEAAVLEARRDELARGFQITNYDEAESTEQLLIDHALDAEDRAAAAEAEVARLTKEAGR